MKIICDELCLKDIEHVTKRLDEVRKILGRANSKNEQEEKELLDKCMALLNDRKWIRQGDWTGKDIEALNSVIYQLIF